SASASMTAGPSTSAPTTTTDPSDTGTDTTDPDTGTETGDTETGDTETTGSAGAPAVVMTSPTDGEAGVHEDAVLVITFSEPMNKVSVQQAYQSADIPAAGVTFSWNANGDELTITPNDPLAYAEGTDPDDTDPIEYTFSLTNVAESQAGVPLDEEVSVSFTTLRRITQILERDADLSGNISDLDGPVGSTFIGDRPNGDAVRYAVTFDLTALAPTVETVETAQLRASWNSQSGDPWAGLGGGTVFEHITYEAFDGPV